MGKLHDTAAGFGVNERNLDALLKYGNEQLNAADFENCYIVDYILDGRRDNTKLIYTLAAHPEYFGNHIDEIKIVVKDIELANVMAMGANKDSLKISYNGIDYVHFKDENFVDEIMSNRLKRLDVYGRVNLNEFNGRESLQLFIDDYDLHSDNSKYEF